MLLVKILLLKRCVGGFTQNNNESLNQIIWNIAPKIMSSGAITVFHKMTFFKTVAKITRKILN